MTITKEQIEAVRAAHAKWVEAGGPHGNSERWIGDLLQALDEANARTAELEVAAAVGDELLQSHANLLDRLEHGALKT